MIKERTVVLHQGVFKKTATTAEAVFMITGITIGAGILGLPYAISQAGLKIGIVYIVVVGLVILFLNLMMGEVVARTKESLQLPGLAGKYVGNWAKHTMSFLIVLSTYGALLAYIVGEWEVLHNFFGGNATLWSVLFWAVGATIVWFGLGAAKHFQTAVSFTVIVLLVLLSLYLFPHIQSSNILYSNINHLFFPYGVVLFALYNLPALAEAHALLPGKPLQFRRALIYGSIIPMLIYVLFVVAVVGSSGLGTHEVVTTGLGMLFGKHILIVGNIIALCAMGTGFVGLGIALKQIFVWDNKVNPKIAYLLVVGVPLLLFLSGIRSFISILNIVGGLFVGIQALMMMLVYWCAKKSHVLTPSPYRVHHVWLGMIFLAIVFISMSYVSFVKIFN
jgi:tyrosine-specific transport protein